MSVVGTQAGEQAGPGVTVCVSTMASSCPHFPPANSGGVREFVGGEKR